jgi:hypothetical protein
VPIIDVHRHAQFEAGSPMEEKIQEFAYTRLNRKDLGIISTTTLHGITAVVYPEVLDIHLQVQGQRDAGVTLGLLSFSMGLEMFCWPMFFLADGPISTSTPWVSPKQASSTVSSFSALTGFCSEVIIPLFRSVRASTSKW